MVKCTRCNKRKSKRFCAALGQSICSLCCGQLREKKIHCPPNCSYLSKHKPYQEKRIIEKRHSSHRYQAAGEEDVLRDERMAWLAFHTEAPLKEHGEKEASFSDKDALIALEYAREKIEKGKGFVLMPDEKVKPQNEVGEAIYQLIEQCRYEGRIILTGESLTYSKDEKLKVLDRIILTLKQLAEGQFEERNYIHAVIERFAKIKGLSQQKKVLTIT